MHRRHLLRNVAGLAFAAAGLAACRVTPIENQVNGEFVGHGTLTQRSDQIRRAAAGLGWIMESRGPGLMRGVLSLRGHQAIVDIPYDTQRFSIRYAGSTNLNYDGTNIHPNYNSWVERLQRTIIAQPPV